MSQLSKQDMDVAIKVLQDKVEFIMKAFTIGNAEGVNKTLLQVYYEVKAGVKLADAVNNDYHEEVSSVSVDEGSAGPEVG